MVVFSVLWKKGFISLAFFLGCVVMVCVVMVYVIIFHKLLNSYSTLPITFVTFYFWSPLKNQLCIFIILYIWGVPSVQDVKLS